MNRAYDVAAEKATDAYIAYCVAIEAFCSGEATAEKYEALIQARQRRELAAAERQSVAYFQKYKSVP